MVADDHQQHKDKHIPAKFIEERRHVPIPHVADGNLHGKGEELKALLSDTQAIGFHIDVIAPAADALTEHKRRCDDVQQGQHGDFMLSADQSRGDQAADYAAVNGHSAFPDIENGKHVFAVIIEAKGDVIQPGANESQRNGIEQKINHRILRQMQAARLARRKQIADDDGAGD